MMYVIGLLVVAFFYTCWAAVDKYRVEVEEKDHE